MKIAIILNTAWNIYNFRLSLIEELEKNEYEVIAIAPMGTDVSRIKERTSCKFIPLKHLSRKGINPIKDLALAYELFRILKFEKIDVVLNFTIKPVVYGSIAARLSKTMVINTLTGLGYSFLTKGVVNKFAKLLYRVSLKKVSKVLFQNKDDLNLFLHYKLVKESQVEIVDGSGIDTEYYMVTDYPTKSEFYVLFVGRLLYDKGIKEFLEAAKFVNRKNPNVHFHIVGEIDVDNPSSIQQKYLGQWTNETYISYHGKVSDIRPFIKKSNVVVLPSYREGLPRAILEGMSMGRPIIATDVPGCRETVIDNENGYLVEVKSSIALAEAVIELSELSDAERRNMGLRSREIVLNRFRGDIINQKYISLINDLLSL